MASCYKSRNNNDKYDALNGDVLLRGYVWLNIPGSAALPTPLGSVPVFINTGNDTSSYIYQVNADSSGKFIVPFLKKDYTYTVYTRFTKNNIQYLGAASFPGNGTDIKLNVYPQYTNGFTITVKDSLGGNAAKTHIRLYTGKLAALTDYRNDAIADTVTDVNGEYTRFNITPSKYYIVIKDSIGAIKFNVLDSITAGIAGDSLKTIVLHY